MKVFITIILTLVVALGIFVGFTPVGRAMFNTYGFMMQKVDDRTLYETRKKVEDSARAMISAYKADALKYEQYKNFTDKEQFNWGEQAKMRANQTATIYNEFMLKNNFVFEGNIPGDINYQLPIIP